MTATTQPAADASSNGDPATAGGGITRLNATDGLFLRAEHLAAMQDYARDLTYAAGLANGTGVVYGFTVTLSDPEKSEAKLQVSPGLAIDPTGRPLRSSTMTEVALPTEPPTVSDPFWVLEILPAQWTYGTEKAFGNLCDDPSNGSTIVPWQAEGLTIRMQSRSMPGLDGVHRTVDRRNWLASQYFERERQNSKPWLTPWEPGGSVIPITQRNWSEGNQPPGPTAVPLAVVQRVNEEWKLDVWTARRDLGDPPARRTWQWRLGMRPWNVFLAQILQFQAQLATLASSTSEGEAEDPRTLITNLDEFVQGMTVRPKQLRSMVDALKKCAPTISAPAGGPALGNQGFVELPPAGFLQVAAQEDDSLLAAVVTLFGENIDVRLCHCRADYVPHAIEQAQHLDRIPLGQCSPRPQVDVLVPDRQEYLADQKVNSYGWVAFVRRREVTCDEDLVNVYVVDGIFNNDTDIPEIDLPKARGFVTYPAGTPWAYPSEKLVEDLSLDSSYMISVVAITRHDGRRTLAALRASLFASCFDAGISAPPIFVKEGMEQEGIIVYKAVPETPILLNRSPT